MDDIAQHELTHEILGFTDEINKLKQTISGSGNQQVTAVTEFTKLTDAPTSYAGSIGKYVKVNDAGTGLEFSGVEAGSSITPNEGWLADNVTEAKTMDTATTTLETLANTLGTLINTLIEQGVLVSINNVTEGLLTESGDFLMTEAGEYLLY